MREKQRICIYKMLSRLREMYFLVILFLINILFSPVKLSAQDSIPSTNLEELIVEGDRQWIEADKIVKIPTVSEKKKSNSPQTLIKAMHMPYLQVKDNVVSDLSGNPVTFFINGEPADEIDISSFWPMDVKRVEYLKNPTSPNFRGMQYVVNFIVAKYSYGGVTKFDLFQRFPNNGYYQIPSKFVYKKMTYGALLTGSYLNNHRDERYGEEIFSDFYYNDVYYDQLKRQIYENGYERSHGLGLSVNARYDNSNINILHTVSVGWNISSESGTFSKDVWDFDLFSAAQSTSSYRFHNISPQVRGDYFFKLSEKWYLSTSWNYSYTRNANDTNTEYGVTNIVQNNSKEDAHSVSVQIQPSYYLNEKLFFYLTLESKTDYFKTKYFGTSKVVARQLRDDLKTKVNAVWMPGRSFRLNIGAGLTASFWDVDGSKTDMIRPSANCNINWRLGSKLGVNLSSGVYIVSPSSSELNNVMIKSTPLLWISGNPKLKAITSVDNFLSIYYYPKSWLNIVACAGYAKNFNVIVNQYESTSKDMGGIVRRSENAKQVDAFRSSLSFIFDPIPQLSISVIPAFYYTYCRPPYSRHFRHFNISGSVDYTIGNCCMSLAYEGPYANVDSSGMEKYWRSDKVNASFTYGNGHFYVSLNVKDIFHKKEKNIETYTASHYYYDFEKYITGRCAEIQLTYTFGYGKKIDESIDIYTPENGNSSVLSR